jgi:hypothetical protein
MTKFLVHAGVENFAAQGFVRGIDPNNGDVTWRYDFPMENGVHQRSNNLYPVFAPPMLATRNRAEALTPVFVTTVFSDVGQVPYGYLYAINYH